MDVNILLNLVTAILAFLDIAYCLDLTVYQTAQFTNPVSSSEFTKFAKHNETGTIYIGAKDALYQLAPDFVKSHYVDTKVESEDVNILCPNYNKILVIDYMNNQLISCGSENYVESDKRGGTCNLRNVSDISVIVHQVDDQVVPPDLLTTEAIIGPGPDGIYLYVGQTFDRDNYYPYIISRRLLLNQENVFPVNGFTSMLFYYEVTINFIGSFLYTGFTYFVAHQQQEESPEFISKISRVCHGDESRGLNSFTEITLECRGQDDNIYNLIQTAYVGPAGLDLSNSFGVDSELNVLYGAFAKSEHDQSEPGVPSKQSALCIFKMHDIRAAMFEAVAGCLGRNPDGTNPPDVANRYQVNYLAGVSYESCIGTALASDDIVRGQLCYAQNWRYAKGIIPLVSTAVIEWTDITPSSIITTTHRNHTIAFVGTMQGDMVKIHIEDKENAREYERFPVGSTVLRDAEFDEDQEQLTILTKQQVIKLNVSKCDEYTTCDDCIGSNGRQDGDPYCGWCILERRCTQYDSCPMAGVSTRWLPYNSAQCVGISMIAPYDSLPITVTEQQITLTVEQLPNLDSYEYQCIFDSISAVPATKSGNQLTCTTPAALDIPVIPNGKDHVTMQLFVHSTESQVKFVQRDFYFYECNNHKGCVVCTNSSWACDWCIYSNRCTHDSGTCSVEDDLSSEISGQNNPVMKQRHGLTECPQLIAQEGEILIPVGVSSDIRVSGTNLPDNSKISSYMCVLSIDGIDVSTAAERSGDELTCQPNMYSYDAAIQEMNATVSVVWNHNRKLDDLYGLHVTLYKCEVQRPDCSRCLSDSTARPELMCGWCNSDSMCTVSDRSQCRGKWLTAAGNQNCPHPVLFSMFPASGPHEGNTIISVTGTDLGTQFSDIISVTVGGQPCITHGLGMKYLTGESISCRTQSGATDSQLFISVTVKGKDGNLQESTGNVVFTYRDPSITSFEPMEGPEAGGTMVTIRGQYLDACSHISAAFGSAECRMSRNDIINATTAICRTTNASVGTSSPLQVFFDGAMRQSSDLFTYKPNPIVTNVHPLKTIESGGNKLTVRGDGFNLAQAPKVLFITDGEESIESCDVHNNTVMICRTPSIKSIASRQKRAIVGEATIGFIIADVTELLTWSKRNNVNVEIYKDPTYEKFNPNPHLKNGDILLINGNNLIAGSSLADVSVYIGETRVDDINLGDGALTAALPVENPGRMCINGNKTKYPCVIVFHGNLEFYIGDIKYPEASNTLAVILGGGFSVVVFLALLVAVAIAYVVFKNRKLEEERDALILERLILLQQCVDDAIHTLSKESTSKKAAQKSIFLPNNVAINPEDVKIRFNQLTMGRALGHGAFGEVFLADLQEAGGNSIQVAVKSIQGKKDPSTIIKFLEEGLIMKDFDHPNVLGLIGLTFDPEGSPLVIIPLMKNGDLKSFLKKTTMEITTEQRLEFAIDAAKGMTYLAGMKFVHRDLAARNCMVDANLVVKIGDFGRSREMEDDYEYISQDKKAKLPVKWMAPESIGYRRYNEKTDVWSFGILLWEIFTNGAKPYRSMANRDIYDHISKGNRLACPEECREDVYDIMLLCWNANPKDRCTFQDLTRRLATILDNLATNLAVETQNEVETLDGEMDRDSYLHPMEEKETEGGDYVNDNIQLAIVGDNGSLEVEGQDNTAVDLEMTSFN